MTRIKFYPHMIFNNGANMGDLLRSIDLVVATVDIVCSLFKGTPTTDDDGSASVQYDDIVEFKELSDEHKEAILKNFPFARVVLSKRRD
jgi:hypothetical protein